METEDDGGGAGNNKDTPQKADDEPVELFNLKMTTPEPPKSPEGVRTKSKQLYETRLMDLNKALDAEKQAHAQSIKDKDSIIHDLKSELKKLRAAKTNDKTEPVAMKMNNTDIFVSKPRKGAKEVQSNGCAVSGCENINVDLIKCCMCEKLVCEDCSKVKVVKLRQLMNQCDTLYFTCYNCALLLRDDSDVNAFDTLKQRVKVLQEELESEGKENGKLSQQIKTMDAHEKSLQSLLEERENALHENETKVVDLEKNLSDRETALQEAESKQFSKEGSSSTETTETDPTSTFENLIIKRLDTFDKKMEELIEKSPADPIYNSVA